MAYRIRRSFKNYATIPFSILLRLPVAALAYLLYKLATAADAAAEFVDYKVLPRTPGIEFEHKNRDAEIDALHE